MQYLFNKETRRFESMDSLKDAKYREKNRSEAKLYDVYKNSRDYSYSDYMRAIEHIETEYREWNEKAEREYLTRTELASIRDSIDFLI